MYVYARARAWPQLGVPALLRWASVSERWTKKERDCACVFKFTCMCIYVRVRVRVCVCEKEEGMCVHLCVSARSRLRVLAPLR